MIYKRFEPVKEVAQFIECYWIIESDSDEITRQKIIPDGFPEIVIHYGDPYQINIAGQWELQAKQLLAGQIRNHFFLENTGKSGMLGIKLRPAAAHYLFKVDMSKLVETVPALDEVAGDKFHDIVSFIHSDKTHQDKIDFCNQFIKRFIDENQVEIDQKTEKAIDCIFSSYGSISVKELCDQVQISERSLERLFKRKIGLSPKYFARIIRFNRVFDLTKNKKLSWSDITHEIGYYDQAHFIKDFKLFSGEDPSRYLFDLENMANFFLRDK